MPTFSDPENPNSPENSSPPPLEVAENGDGASSARPRLDPEQMQIVPVVPNTPFQLPDGWVVEVRPRSPKSSVSSDKYYYEPGTGRRFRSLLSIKRYLTGEEEPPPRKKQTNCLVPYQNPGPFRRVVYGGKVKRSGLHLLEQNLSFLRQDELEEARHSELDDIVPATVQPRSPSLIPDGWIVEEVPRRDGLRCDRYYIEPVTGQKFRSVPEVQRYLAGENYRSRCRALTMFNHATAPRSPASRRKKTSVKMPKDSIFDLTNPPEKVNWIFNSDGTESWSPLVEEGVLPDHIKEHWAETFLLGMNGWKHRVPQLTMSDNNQAKNA